MNKLTKVLNRNLKNMPFLSLSNKSFSDVFKNREKAEEDVYVNKQERELMKKLLKKIKTEHNPDHESNEINELKAIFKKHNIEASNTLIGEIQKWRDVHH